MKLDMFKMQIDEDKVNDKIGDLKSRVKELKALNNNAKTICKKVASEFGKDYDSIMKLLLPQDLKQYVSMTTEKKNRIGVDKMKALTFKYSKYKPTVKGTNSFIITQIMYGYIEK